MMNFSYMDYTADFGIGSTLKNIGSKVKNAVKGKKPTRVNYFPDLDEGQSIVKNIRKRTKPVSDSNMLNKTGTTVTSPNKKAPITGYGAPGEYNMVNRTGFTKTYATKRSMNSDNMINKTSTNQTYNQKRMS